MKKIVPAAALALVLACATGTTAYAAGTGDQTQEVKGTYQAGGTSAIVYSVDVTWSNLNFTYTAAGEGTWNPESHSYSGGSAASWSGSGSVTVTNHSNASVKATASYKPDSGYESAGMTFGSNGSTIATAVGTAYSSAPSTTITVTPTGSLPESTNGKIGTITVNIAAAQ